jgi:formyl-CoA transferase
MPIKLSASPAVIERSPLLGEHTESVLKTVLGYEDGRIESMKQAGAFSASPKKAAPGGNTGAAAKAQAQK